MKKIWLGFGSGMLLLVGFFQNCAKPDSVATTKYCVYQSDFDAQRFSCAWNPEGAADLGGPTGCGEDSVAVYLSEPPSGEGCVVEL